MDLGSSSLGHFFIWLIWWSISLDRVRLADFPVFHRTLVGSSSPAHFRPANFPKSISLVGCSIKAPVFPCSPSCFSIFEIIRMARSEFPFGNRRGTERVTRAVYIKSFKKFRVKSRFFLKSTRSLRSLWRWHGEAAFECAERHGTHAFAAAYDW